MTCLYPQLPTQLVGVSHCDGLREGDRQDPVLQHCYQLKGGGFCWKLRWSMAVTALRITLGFEDSRVEKWHRSGKRFRAGLPFTINLMEGRNFWSEKTIYYVFTEHNGASLVAQKVKRLLSGMQETWVQSLGREDPLDKEMAIQSSTLAGKISGMEEPSRLQSQRVGHDWATSLSLNIQVKLSSNWMTKWSYS